jgi:hypothetical protein
LFLRFSGRTRQVTVFGGNRPVSGWAKRLGFDVRPADVPML